MEGCSPELAVFGCGAAVATADGDLPRDLPSARKALHEAYARIAELLAEIGPLRERFRVLEEEKRDLPSTREALHEANARIAELLAENERLRERVRILEEEKRDLEAKVAGLNQLHFGRSSEKRPPPPPPAPDAAAGTGRRKRGQQPGSKGHGRRNHEHLPTTVEERDLPEDEKRCPCCGLPFRPRGFAEDSEKIEIDVKAHRRVIRRKRYQKVCSCPGLPAIVTAPPPPAVIPKSPMGVSIWVTVLLDKFLYYRPTYRLLKDLESHGLSLALGTLTGGLRQLLPLFEPIYAALHEKCLEADHWHADETRWSVFVKLVGKEGTRWYLWVFKSRSAVYFHLDPSRAAEVAIWFFREASGIVSADRYSAYKALMAFGRLLIAFCWAHVRRDVVRVGDRYDEHAEWAKRWIDRIAKLYDLNQTRLSLRDDPEAFRAANEELRLFLKEMERIRDAELAAAPSKEKAKILESMRNHWEGLTLFFGFAEVPLDNSEAERLVRGPAVGRKNYYGSGSIWSGRLAAAMFSIFATLELHGVCPRKWLTRYLSACAELRGKVPEDFERFLPWNLSDEDRAALVPGRPSPDTS